MTTDHGWQGQLDALEGALARQSSAVDHLASLSGNAAVRDAVRQHAAAVREMATALRGATVAVRRLRGDATLYPRGREQLVAEEVRKAKAAADKAQQLAQGLKFVVHNALFTQALPRLREPEREALTRDETLMLLRDAADPTAVLAELAQGDDDLAAVAVSSWAESFLRAQRFKPEDARTHAAAVRHAAVAAASKSSDPQRQAAAEALELLPSLDGQLQVARSLAEYDLSAALAEPPAVPEQP